MPKEIGCRRMYVMKRITLLLFICAVYCFFSTEMASAKSDYSVSQYKCTDGLGRTIAGYEETGPIKEDKFVGVFYWTWHSAHSQKRTANVTEILKEHPGIEHDFYSSYWKGSLHSYFWDEPLFGYYDGLDKWVYRRHAELLAAAQVDVIIFDCTNGTDLFWNAVDLLMETFAEAREDGVDTPQIAFMLPFWDKTANAIDLRELWTKLYAPKQYQDLWFYWKGKPLVLGLSGGLNENNETDRMIKEFFTFRSVQASYIEGQKENLQWGWLAAYPQTVYSCNGVKEEISVGVAQNYSDERGLTAMNAGETVHGRSWSVQKGGKDTQENAVLYGANFAEQFEYAIQMDPEFIFITGWNEWVAGRHSRWEGIDNAFPDQFSAEYSRDIEPSAGILQDHYYYQMVDYIRRFKGCEASLPSSGKQTIDIYGDTAQWDSVLPYFLSYAGNTEPRDGSGYNDIKYQNDTGRNDIIGAKVTYDEEFLYFMAETSEPLTPYTDPAWMRLLIDVEGMEAGNWETYEFIVNRVAPEEDGAWLERSIGGWNWEKVGKTEFSVQNTVLQIKIPRQSLGISDREFTVNFKWSDNWQEDGNILDFYSNGDVAPIGRFRYSYSSLTAPSRIVFFTLRGILLLVGGILLAAGLVITAMIFYKKQKGKNENVM